MGTTIPTEPRRTRRYRLPLLLGAGAVAVLAVVVATVVPPALRQREAVARIRALGGMVTYDFELSPGGRQAKSLSEWLIGGMIDRRDLPDPDHDGRAWLRRLLGPDLFHSIDSVNLVCNYGGKSGELQGTSGLYHEDLAFLTRLSELRRLFLHKEQACDRVLDHIRGLKRIESLYLSEAKVTDRGIENLESLKRLRYLHLGQVGVSDAGLASLADLADLEDLVMQGNDFTDAGLVHLRGMTKLRSLSFRAIDGGTNRITGAGIKDLSGLTELENLALVNGGFADAGVEHLAPFRKLKVLLLEETALTPEGERRLRKTVPPGCTITITIASPR